MLLWSELLCRTRSENENTVSLALSEKQQDLLHSGVLLFIKFKLHLYVCWITSSSLFHLDWPLFNFYFNVLTEIEAANMSIVCFDWAVQLIAACDGECTWNWTHLSIACIQACIRADVLQSATSESTSRCSDWESISDLLVQAALTFQSVYFSQASVILFSS